MINKVGTTRISTCADRWTHDLATAVMVKRVLEKSWRISQFKKSKSQRLVSSLYEISKSTIADGWKAREKTELHVSVSDNPSFAKKRCVIKEANLENLCKAAYT